MSGPRLAGVLAGAILGSPAVRAWAAEAPISSSSEAAFHRDSGEAFYRAGDYDAAAAEFQAAYAIDPRPELLFAWAQARRLGGDCDSALALYRRFLATRPPPRQVEAARLAMARCAPIPPPEPPVAARDAAARVREARPAGAAPARASEPTPSPWYRDFVGGALLAGGVVATGVGVGFLLGARSASDSANSAGTYEQHEARSDEWRSRRQVAIVGIATGAALVAAAAARYAWRARAAGRR